MRNGGADIKSEQKGTKVKKSDSKGKSEKQSNRVHVLAADARGSDDGWPYPSAR